MIDIHCHVLPSIDDGAALEEESIQMLREAQIAGFTKVIATSHYMKEAYETQTEQRENLIQSLQSKLNLAKIELSIYNGAEIYSFEELVSEIEEKKVPTLAGSSYVLIEFPMYAKPMGMEDILYAILRSNKIPIIAHPERYSYVQNDPNQVIEWIEAGVLLQANYGSIIGLYGNQAKNTAVKLLSHHMIHFLGTDCHRKNSIYTKMDVILKKIDKQIGKEERMKLTCENPEKILLDEKIQIENPKKITRHFLKN